MNSPIQTCCLRNGCGESLKFLLNFGVDIRDSFYQARGKNKIIQVLLDNVNIMDNFDPFTKEFLYSCGDEDICFDIYIKNIEEKKISIPQEVYIKAIFKAVSNNLVRNVKILSRFTGFEIVNTRNRTLLMEAVDNGKYQVSKYLAKNCKNSEVEDSKGKNIFKHIKESNFNDVQKSKLVLIIRNISNLEI